MEGPASPSSHSRDGELGALRILGKSRGDTFWLRRNKRRSKEWDRWTNHFFSVDVLSGQGKYLRIRPINALPREEDKGHRPRASIHWAVHTVPPTGDPSYTGRDTMINTTGDGHRKGKKGAALVLADLFH